MTLLRLTLVLTALLLGMGAATDRDISDPTASGLSIDADAAAANLSIRATVIDFGTVPLGTCLVDAFTIENLGLTPIRVPIPASLSAPSSPIRLLPRPQDTLELPARRFDRIEVEFCAIDTGCFSTTYVFRSTDGESDTIVVRGCASNALTVIERETIDFGLTRVGSTEARIYRTTNAAQSPLTLYNLTRDGHPDFRSSVTYPREGKTVGVNEEIAVPIDFRPSGEGDRSAIFRLVAGDGFREITAIGRGGASKLAAEPQLIDFGPVPVGGSVEMPVRITNNGDMDLNISRHNFSDAAFSLAPGEPEARTIKPGMTADIGLRFAPGGPGVMEETDRIESDNMTGNVELSLEGEGLDVSSRIIYLDTTDTDVGSPTVLRLRVDPPLSPSEKITNISATLFFIPTSLSPVGVSPPADATGIVTTMSRRTASESDQVTVNVVTTGYLTGSDLAEITFVGLSTGDSINTIPLFDVAVATPVEWGRGAGMIRLSGCGLGSVPGVFKKVTIESAASDGVGESIAVRYRAPYGAPGNVSLFDLTGRPVRTIDLPPGDGGSTTATVPSGDLPPGAYFVRVRMGDDAAGTLMLHRR